MTTVLLAHGSPDARHSATLERLRSRVAEPLAAAGRGSTHLVYIENDHPRPEELGPRLDGDVTVVPMLITPAFHARVDVPAAVRALGVTGASVVTGTKTMPSLATSVAAMSVGSMIATVTAGIVTTAVVGVPTVPGRGVVTGTTGMPMTPTPTPWSGRPPILASSTPRR